MTKNIVYFVLALLVALIGNSNAKHSSHDVTNGQFVLGTGGHEIFLPNQKRTSDPVFLKLSFPSSSHGDRLYISRVTGVTPNTWSLYLNDDTVMILSAEQSLVNPDAVQKFSIYLPGAPRPHNAAHPNITNHIPNRELCINYAYRNASWYNGYQSMAPSWPMNTSRVLPTQPFNNVRNFTGDSKIEDYHLILEQLFVNSDGFAVTFDHRQPLFLRRDPNLGSNGSTHAGEPLLCFSANNSGPYDPLNEQTSYRALRMHIYMEKNIREVLDYTIVSSRAIRRLESVPDDAKLRYPTWSIETAPSSTNGHSRVLSLAETILKHGFSAHSQLMFDDYQQRESSVLELSNSSYPNHKGMLEKLHSIGFTRLGMAAPAGTSKYRKGQRHEDNSTVNFFIPYYNASNPTGINSTDVTSVIDFSSPAACEWYQYLMHRAKYEYGFSAFQLNPISIRWLMGFRDEEVHRFPALITQKYVECASKLGREVVTDVAYETQNLPVFVRMTRSNGDYDLEGQLLDLIPNALSISIAGYAFVVPYQVGGFSWQLKPSAELYIRWVQAVALMPTMQFLHLPWSYTDNASSADGQVLNITKHFVELHEKHGDVIVALGKERISIKGSPIIRPLWYEAPEDFPAAYHVKDQFMLGSSILVAPILRMHQRERDVYLPINGSTWVDQHGGRHAGGRWIRVKAPLEELPYFTKQRKLCSFCEGLLP